jgi:hypothetical protein
MSLLNSRPQLEKAIKQAFLSSKNDAETGSLDPDSIIDVLARDIAAAVHDYVTSANVDLQTVVSTANLSSTSTIADVSHSGFGKLR